MGCGGDRGPVGGWFLKKACKYIGLILLTFQWLCDLGSELLHILCDMSPETPSLV